MIEPVVPAEPAASCARGGRKPLHGGVEIGAGLLVVLLIVALGFLGFSDPVSSVEPTSPIPESSQGARIEAARIQAQATENTGIRTTRVAVVAGSGVLLGLLLSFLNYNREQRRDEQDHAIASEERRHDVRRYHLERYSQAIEHLKDESPIVRAGGVKALEILANEPDGPRDEVRAVIRAKRKEDGLVDDDDQANDGREPAASTSPAGPTATRGQEVPVDVQAARDAWERIGAPRIFVIAPTDDLVSFGRVLARWCGHVVPAADIEVFAPLQTQSLEHRLRFSPPDVALFILDPAAGKLSEDGVEWWHSRGLSIKGRIRRIIAPAASLPARLEDQNVLATNRSSLRDLAITLAARFGVDADLSFLDTATEEALMEQLNTVRGAFEVNRTL